MTDSITITMPQRQYASKLEASYAQRLDLLLRSQEIEWWDYEAMKFRLAGNTFYTPDFAVVRDGRFWFDEVKGRWRQHDRVKIKAAATKFPMFRFQAVMRDRHGWLFEQFKP